MSHTPQLFVAAGFALRATFVQTSLWLEICLHCTVIWFRGKPAKCVLYRLHYVLGHPPCLFLCASAENLEGTADTLWETLKLQHGLQEHVCTGEFKLFLGQKLRLLSFLKFFISPLLRFAVFKNNNKNSKKLLAVQLLTHTFVSTKMSLCSPCLPPLSCAGLSELSHNLWLTL